MATKHEQWKQRVRKARVPAYFKGLLIDASIRKVVRSAGGEAGRSSFFNPGFELGRNVGQYIDAEVYEELEKILGEPVEVASATTKKNSCDLCLRLFKKAVVPASKTENDFENTRSLFGSGTKWLRKHLGRFFGLVPANRRPVFVEGFTKGFEENH